MSEIRCDKLHNQYVLIAPERLHRPNAICAQKVPLKAFKRCPFCEGNESLTPKEVFALRDNEPNTAGWKTRVVPNLYKAVQIELEQASWREGMFETISGLGAHEILIDSPNHGGGFEKIGPEGVKNWLQSIIFRSEDLQKDRRLVYLSVFKNEGFNAGATQSHPHTQILALPMMPKKELMFLENKMAYYKRHGRGLLEDIVHNEILFEKRIIAQVGDFIAFCPFASAFPFEVMIAPLKNLSNLTQCNQTQLSNVATLLVKVFTMLSTQLGNFDYNLSFALPPLNSNYENAHLMASLDMNFRFSVRIMPRIYTLGGFELSTEMFINCVEPEVAAKLLRGEK
jgi:UDPglucose--hexose-1-phosphate uridylyltransferase